MNVRKMTGSITGFCKNTDKCHFNYSSSQKREVRTEYNKLKSEIFSLLLEFVGSNNEIPVAQNEIQGYHFRIETVSNMLKTVLLHASLAPYRCNYVCVIFE